METIYTLKNFVYAMLMNPGVQKVAQNELDDVVGRNRLPDIKDKKSLPYVTALMKEVLRYAQPHHLRPQVSHTICCEQVAPDPSSRFADNAASAVYGVLIRTAGLARRSVIDDEYNGYLIPAGSIILCNTWYTILHALKRTTDHDNV